MAHFRVCRINPCTCEVLRYAGATLIPLVVGIPIGFGDKPEAHARDAEVEHVLDGDVDRVLRADEPGLETGETRLHQQHQDRADQDPDRIDRLRNATHNSPPAVRCDGVSIRVKGKFFFRSAAVQNEKCAEILHIFCA